MDFDRQAIIAVESFQSALKQVGSWCLQQSWNRTAGIMDTPITIFEQINNAREKLSLPLLLSASETEGGVEAAFKCTFSKEVLITNSSTTETEPESEASPEEKGPRDFDDILIAELEKIINADDDSDQKKILLDEWATHLHVVVSAGDDGTSFTCQIVAYYRYLDLEPIGPMIDGDLVVQGSSLNPDFGPSFCQIEYASSAEVAFEQISTIEPTKMIITPATESETMKFVIPISVTSEYHEGIISVLIFSDKLSNINYEDKAESSSPASQRCTIKFSTSSTSGIQVTKSTAETVTETVAAATSVSSDEALVCVSIKIATDYDEIMALQNEGYELNAIAVTHDGILMEQEHMWKHFIMAKYADVHKDGEDGVEDVTWVKCLKSLGALPTLMGYQVHTDYDLSGVEHDYSVYLAVKNGPNPLFRRMMMAASSIDDEEAFKQYVNAQKAVFRPAPTEMAQMLGGPCGMLLLTIDGASLPQGENGAEVDGLDMDEMLSDDEEEHSQKSGMYGATDEDIMNELRARIATLQGERGTLSQVNSDLQKKASQLLFREKSLQGQTAAARTVAEVTAVADVPSSGTTAEAATLNNTSAIEQTKENERQYSDEVSC